MPKIVIEPGSHPAYKDEQNSVYQKTLRGNSGAHEWNGEVRSRINSYRPSILAIDSVEPVYEAKTGISWKDKAWIWSLLPGKPSQLNDTDEIFIVAGDNTYSEPDPNNLVPFLLREASLVAWAYAGFRIAAGSYNRLKSNYPVPESPQPKDFKARRQLRKRQITRRRFIGLAGSALGITAFLSDKIAAYAPYGFVEGVAEDVNDEVGELSFDRLIDPDSEYKYIDGRTALLIAKLKDAISHGGFGTTGAVVIGATHLAKTNDLLHDSGLRDAYIRAHAKLVVNAAAKDTHYFSGPSTVKERQESILDTERKIQIFRVLEPDKKAFSSNAQKEIDRIVGLVDVFDSPSVTAAVDGVLRMPKN